MSEQTWIQTYSGLKFDLINPHPSMVNIEDIAHALANQCRFNGHCKDFYSVAEHSVYVATFVNQTHPELFLDALLHDGEEAYLGDIVTPLKPLLPELKPIAKRISGVIGDRFGCHNMDHPVIKQADRQLLVDEKNQLHKFPNNYEWLIELSFTPNLGRKFARLNPHAAEALFLHAFRRAMQHRSLDKREY